MYARPTRCALNVLRTDIVAKESDVLRHRSPKRVSLLRNERYASTQLGRFDRVKFTSVHGESAVLRRPQFQEQLNEC